MKILYLSAVHSLSTPLTGGRFIEQYRVATFNHDAVAVIQQDTSADDGVYPLIVARPIGDKNLATVVCELLRARHPGCDVVDGMELLTGHSEKDTRDFLGRSMMLDRATFNRMF